MLLFMCDFFLLFLKCDFFAYVVKNESTLISNFWKQIVGSTVKVVNKIFRNFGCALYRPSDRVRGCGTAQFDQSRTIPHNF